MQSPSKRLWDWCWENVQPQQPKIGQFATPRICETEKGGIPFAVRVAGCCEPRRGSFATPPLIPATKSQAKPADLERFLRPCKPCSKPPEFRSKTVYRVLPPPSRQSRRTGRHSGSQGGKKDRREFPAVCLNEILFYKVMAGPLSCICSCAIERYSPSRCSSSSAIISAKGCRSPFTA